MNPGRSLNQLTREFDYELIPTPCCRVDIDGTIAECNSQLAQLVERSKDMLVETAFIEIIEAKSRSELLGTFSSIMTGRLPANFHSHTVWVKGKTEGACFPCSLHFKGIRDKVGNLTSVNVSLVDESRYQAQIEQAQKDKEHLKKIEKLKDEFIAVASHELRTPIQPILGFAMLAKKGMMTEQAAWDGVLQEARRLQQLANDILDVSRIEAGSLNYVFQKEKINQLLSSLSNSLRTELPKEISLNVVHEDAESELEIEADRSRITQVVSNLISNAVKFTEKGEITVQSKAFPQKNEIEIRVIDTGRGISEQIIPFLFEKFATRGHGNVQNNKGTGLGLYITKAIVDAHRGRISAFNNEQGGATFVIVLPISQPKI